MKMQFKWSTEVQMRDKLFAEINYSNKLFSFRIAHLTRQDSFVSNTKPHKIFSF